MFSTIKALEAAIRRHIAATNADPRPFVWTKSADDILNSVRRFCRRMLTSASAKKLPTQSTS